MTVVLLGEPVAFARARLGKTGTHFTPAKQRNTMAALRIAAQQAMIQANYGMAVFDEPLRMDVEAQFPVPASWSRRKREMALRGEIRPSVKPDLSNILKLIEDACNRVVYRDDALIVEYGRARKVYSDQPKIIVTIQPITPAYRGPLSDMVHDIPDDDLDRAINAGAGK